jgi:hypothetical protein
LNTFESGLLLTVVLKGSRPLEADTATSKLVVFDPDRPPLSTVPAATGAGVVEAWSGW